MPLYFSFKPKTEIYIIYLQAEIKLAIHQSPNKSMRWKKTSTKAGLEVKLTQKSSMKKGNSYSVDLPAAENKSAQ